MTFIDLLSTYHIMPQFPPAAVRQGESMPTTVSSEDLIGRKDLTDKLIITIDGDDAKDFDDAISIERLENGNYCLGVHIADVTHYVKEGSPIDRAAFSRGTSVFFEEPINPKAEITLKKMGIENFEHMSQQVSETDISDADIILTMTSSHKMLLKSKFPKYANKIFTLSEKAYGKDKSISDPYGQSEDVYMLCAKEIEEAVTELLKKI